MTRGTVAPIQNLNLGDRFYRKSDGGKKVFELLEQPQESQKELQVRQINAKYPQEFKQDTQVVFLRSLVN